MAGKPITRGSPRVAYAIGRLSKNTLADIVLDRIGAEIGEDADDEAVLAHLQTWLDTVARLRGDKPVDLIQVKGRARECHLCERSVADGAFRPFVDGLSRWVCNPCQRDEDIDAAQEIQDDLDDL